MSYTPGSFPRRVQQQLTDVLHAALVVQQIDNGNQIYGGNVDVYFSR